jgi:hypothetical protein
MAHGCSLGLVELLHPSEHMFDSSGSGSFESWAIGDPEAPTDSLKVVDEGPREANELAGFGGAGVSEDIHSPGQRPST